MIRSRTVILGILLFATLSAVALVRGTTPTAAAQDAPSQKDLDDAKAAYLAGKALFEKKKYAEAVEKFKDSYRLSRNPLLLFNIALTFSELGTKDMALFYYKKFLDDAPADAAQRPEVEQAVKDLEKEIAASTEDDGGKVDDGKVDDGKVDDGKVDDGKVDDGSSGSGDDGKVDDGKVDDGGKVDDVKAPPRDYTIADFEHEVVDEAPPGKPLDLIASPDDAPWTVTLYYRGQHDEKFTGIVMRSHHNTLVARIPAKVMTGNAVQYYIEVKDKADALLTRVGKSTSPNVVYLDPEASAQYYPDLEDEGGGKGKGTNVLSHGDEEDPLGGRGQEEPGGGGGGIRINPSGPGLTDVGSSKFKYAKWGTTGTGIGMLTLSITFYLMSSSYAASLEAEAAASNDDDCPEGPPCRTFDDYRKGIQTTGRRYQTISRITFGVGLAAAGVAGWFWYKELKARKRGEKVGAAKADASTTGVSTAPLIGDDLLGAAAAWRF